MEQITIDGMTVKIKTDGKERELICYEELPENVKQEFDYLDDEDKVSPRFVRYKDVYYDVIDTMMAPNWALKQGWHARIDLTFSSLYLVHFTGESVIMGYAFT